MSPDNAAERDARGPIAYMVWNGVAANFLMFLIVGAGLVSLTGLVKEAYPVLNFDAVEVSVPYPGATPAEVEESIVLKVEEQLRTLDAVDRITAVAAPGIGSVIAELKLGEDIDRALDDIGAAVGRIQTFPAAAERPEVRAMTHRQSVIRAVLHGDVPERALKELAYRIEDELASLPLVSHVETSGVRSYEISIEVPLHHLRALGLTLDDVADAIRSESLDLSGGVIETRDAEVLVRTVGQNYAQYDFEDIVVMGRGDGTMVRLGDIAEVHDGFQDVGLILRHDGQPAAFVEVYRVAGEQILEVARAVEQHLEQRFAPALPPGLQLTIWNNDAQIYEERLDLLVGNGLQGLVLVLLMMTLFLQLRLAVWVALGIAISFIGTAATMLVFDVSVNTVSLFAFILAVGIVVDDAVVVAENVHLERQKGTRADLAAIRGTRRMRTPLIFGVLTTVVAVVPLLFIPGPVGALMGSVPIILISVLIISLLESLLILPNHLSHLPGPGWQPSHPSERFVVGIQARVDGLVQWFVNGPLDRALRLAIGQPAVVLAGGVGAVVLVIALIPAGIVDIVDVVPVEGDVVTARLEMPKGTLARRTHAMAAELEAAGRRVVDKLELDRPANAPPLLIGANLLVGMAPRTDFGSFTPEPGLTPQSHLATVEFRLAPQAQRRAISAGDFQSAWREEVGEVTGAQALTFTSTVFDLGRAIHVDLSHSDPARIGSVGAALAAGLRELRGVYGIQSDHTEAIEEIQLRLRPDARTLGLSLEALAGQVRSAFFGREALRVPRGREDVRVYVRLPAAQRDNIADLEGYLIRTPSGGEVPLSRVANLRSADSPSSIHRTDGQRIVTVTADVDPAVVTPAEVSAILAEAILPDLQAANPGLTYTFGGRQQRQADFFGSMGRGAVIALLVMYGMLAIPLGSYGRPLLIMAVIPFGVVGAILGHMVMGIHMSPESFLGVVGLSGIVVNDSLVMLDLIDQRLREGATVEVAVMDGAKRRFRPIFLTSATTFLGFAPLMLDASTQAQFLSPLAVSLGGGIVVATAIVMVLLPALATVFLRARRSERTHWPPAAVEVDAT